MPNTKKTKEVTKPLVPRGSHTSSDIESVIAPVPGVDVSALAAKVDALEKKDIDNQKELEMLRSVADKGRVMNYESKTVGKKSIFVKLSKHDGKIVVGWRTLKDVLVKNPTTGLTVGEEQEYELMLLDEDGKIKMMTVNGYSRFTDIRYTERISARVIGKKEDEDGNFTFTVLLPDEREIELDQRFLN